MSPAEQLDFKELRAEMREGFARLEDLVTGVAVRVDSLEKTRDVEEGIRKARHERVITDRWLVGVAFTAGSFLAYIALNVHLFVSH